LLKGEKIHDWMFHHLLFRGGTKIVADAFTQHIAQRIDFEEALLKICVPMNQKPFLHFVQLINPFQPRQFNFIN